MNKDKLTSFCHKISKETGLPFNSIMHYYFLESILQCIAKSDFKENFIFKGGFLLSNVVGIKSRSTTDMDFLLDNMKLSEEKIQIMLNEVLKRNEDKGISYKIQDIKPIKGEDSYGGLRVSIICKLENIRQTVPIDIATGDIVTPNSIDYKYISLFGNEDIIIKAYPIESMIAEKIQTIYSKGFLNSRSKDYYDLYILYQLRKDKINQQTLIKACGKTFQSRETEFDLLKIRELLEKLKIDESFIKRWRSYAKKNVYVQGISFEDVIGNALKLLDVIKTK